MAASETLEEIGSLSEIYAHLRHDAKAIVADLRGGVGMWRGAAGANIAAAGFLLILALTTYEKLGTLGLDEGSSVLPA